MTPYPYQQTGREWLSRHPAGILADEPGLGKTCQALLAARDAGCRSLLVVCPAVLKRNWQAEAAKWQCPPMAVIDAGDRLPLDGWSVINYDILHRYRFANPVDCLVLDEAHSCKSIKARRTQAALSIPAARRWMLTGTPLLSHPEELWPLLAACSFAEWGDREKYIARYAPPYSVYMCGRHIPRYGRAHMDELANRLHPWMLRRLKSEVLPDLPEKTVSTVEIAAPLPEYPKDMQAADFARIRHEEAVLRAPACAEYCKELLSGGVESLVVWFWHRDVGEYLADVLPQVCLVDGSTPLSQRDTMVRKFQEGRARVFCGQIAAAGVGLTLTRASRAVFVERTWTPATNTQAEDRIHRIGQASHVQIDVLMVPGSTDYVLSKLLALKRDCAARVLGDNKLAAMFSIMR